MNLFESNNVFTDRSSCLQTHQADQVISCQLSYDLIFFFRKILIIPRCFFLMLKKKINPTSGTTRINGLVYSKESSKTSRKFYFGALGTPTLCNFIESSISHSLCFTKENPMDALLGYDFV